MYALKTKYVLVGGAEHEKIRSGSNVTTDGDTFEAVEEPVYHGSSLTPNSNVSRGIQRYIIMHCSGSRSYSGLPKKLRSKEIHSCTK